MRILLILVSVAILIALSQADAQKKPNITKPVVNSEKRPQPVWHRPPEERRKLSLFPRNSKKFVVTPKIIKNDDDAKEILPTKRPLMRKFVMHDKNEKGTWSFAPREGLMKTQRFTVTLAPPKSNNQKVNDEMKPEESHKVHTVINNVHTKPKSSKTHNLNKGNLIEIVTLKNELTTSKNLNKIEPNLTKEILQTTKNDTQDSQLVEVNGNKIQPTFGESLMDVRSFNDDGIILDDDVTIKMDNGEYNSVNKTTETLNTEVLDDLIESRTVDLGDIIYTTNQNKHGTDQSVNINNFEILLEKLVNNTELLNTSSEQKLKDSSHLIFTVSNNDNNTTIKDIIQMDVAKPNAFYDVISLRNVDEHNTMNEPHAVSETNTFNDKYNFTEHVADTLMGNLENLLNVIENGNVRTTNRVIYDGPTENSDRNKDELKTINDVTLQYTTSKYNNDEITSQHSEDKQQSQSLKEANKTDSDSHDLSIEIYESNLPLSGEEVSTECDEYDCHESISGNINISMEETSNQELVDHRNRSSLEEITNTSISDNSNYYAEERSNESLISESNNLRNRKVSSEAYLNKAEYELSNESFADNSLNTNKRISSVSLLESSNNLTAEQTSNESSSNTADEELSNESYYSDKSNNLTGEISIDSINENSNYFSDELINKSFSNEARDKSYESYLTDYISKETSNDATAEQSSNISSEEILTDDIAESIDISNNFTVEQTSNESLSNNVPETIESTNNFTAEQVRNESSLDLSVVENLNNTLIENISEEIMETSNNFSEIVIDNINVRVSDVPDLNSNNRSEEEIAEDALLNRFKRSNNIIEEENIQTTVSGYTYTARDIKLNHDLSYKNINA